MKREHVIIGLLVLALVMISTFWAVSVIPNARTWQDVDFWNGAKFWNLNLDYNNPLNNNATTNQFQITGDQWRVIWSGGGGNIAAHFVIRVYDDSSNTVIKEITTNADNPFGSADLDSKGIYHLQIFINGFSAWEVKALQYK